MRKKLLTALLIITIIIQIAIPAGMLISKSVEISQIKSNGQFHTFTGYRPYYSNGRLYVRLSIFGPEKQYVTINHDAEGTMYYEHSEEKPDNPVYIDRYGENYQTNEFGVTFPEVFIKTKHYDNITSIDFVKKLSINSYDENPPENVAYYDEVTIDTYIWKGKVYVTAIYIDGVDSSDFLEQYNNR